MDRKLTIEISQEAIDERLEELGLERTRNNRTLFMDNFHDEIRSTECELMEWTKERIEGLQGFLEWEEFDTEEDQAIKSRMGWNDE